ncbi:MAG: PilZ domain-containing protein [Deltaproteobacteria bacterium]|nr:PilZ domain-containing protein [Deltaproteobacteria bacterium]
MVREKRRYKRVRAQGIAAHIWVDNMSSSAVIENISLGGLFIRTPRPLPINTVLAIVLVKPGLKRALRLSGRVVAMLDPMAAGRHLSPPGMGVEFDPPDADTTERLNQLLVGLGCYEPGVLIPLEQSISRVLSREQYQAELPPAGAVPRPEVPVRPPPAAAPAPDEPIGFKIEVPSTARETPADRARLMSHIQGLLAQLALAEDKLRARDLEVEVLTTQLNRLRHDLHRKDAIINELIAHRSEPSPQQ